VAPLTFRQFTEFDEIAVPGRRRSRGRSRGSKSAILGAGMPEDSIARIRSLRAVKLDREGSGASAVRRGAF